MNKVIKYTKVQEEQAIIKMYQNGLTAGDKSKIIKARKLPKNTMDHFDLFKTYFLSGEGILPLIKKLSDKEKMVLHILAFNQWITDIRVFEAAYKELPKPSKYYYIDRGTFTQKYGSVLKAVQTNLVQKGLLVKYEEPLGGNAKAERQRFMFPTAFMEYLPSPFLALKTIEGKGEYSDENIRKELQQAIQTSPKSTLSGVAFKSNKLRQGAIMLNEEHISKIKLRHWQLADSALILSSQYFDEGKSFASFIFFHLKRLAPNQWFTEDALATLLYIWDYPKKRNELDIDKKYPARYSVNSFCEAGWKAGLLERKKVAKIPYYRLAIAEEATTDFDQYLQVKEDGTLRFKLATIPLSILTVLNQVAFLQKLSVITIFAKPDLVHISNSPAAVWSHPLIAWLRENATAFDAAFIAFKKKYGKEIIHKNLLVAKITDLSLRVLVEKGLQKNQSIILLSDEYIAFPKSALATVERIVSKSGNVIKQVVQQ